MQKLSKSFGLSMLGNVAYGLQILFIVVALSKLGTLHDVGRFGYASALLAPIQLLVALNLNALIINNNKEIAEVTYLKFCLLQVFLFQLIVVLLSLFHGKELGLVILMLGILKSVEMIANNINSIKIRNYLIGYVCLSQLIRSAAVVSGFAISYMFFNNLAMSLLLASLLSAFILFKYDLNHIFISLRGQFISRLSYKLNFLKEIDIKKLSLLALIPTIDSFVQNLPRYVANKYNDLEAVGTLTMMLYIVSPPIMVLVALASVVAPRLRDSWSAKDMAKYTFLSICSIFFSVGLCGVFYILFTQFGDVLISALFSAESEEFDDYYNVLFLGALFWYLSAMIFVSLNAANLFYVNLVASVTALVVALIAIRFLQEQDIIRYAINIFTSAMMFRCFVGLSFFCNILIKNVHKSHL